MSDTTGADATGDDVRSEVRSGFDWERTAPTTAIAETLAAAADRDPLALEPLFDTVDPDALDALFRSLRASGDAEETTLSVPIAGWQVTVYGDGAVVVREH